MPHSDPLKRREYHREYMRKHPQVLTKAQKEKKRAYMKKYLEKNSDSIAEYQQKRELKPERKLYRHQKSAELRSLDFALTTEEFNDLLFADCHYCGSETAMGVDRKDNTKGYFSYNVVACCKTCNLMKRDMPYADFIQHTRRIGDKFA